MATVNSYTRMVPTPDRTSLDAIVAAASDLLEHTGLTGVTMQAVAQVVGVRAPSLYKRVPSRERLIQLVAEATISQLASRLDAAVGPADLAGTLRAFGHERPAAFQLIMTPGPGVPAVGDEFRLIASAAILRTATELAGPEHALEAARTLTAWAAGFIGMELNGVFKLGGDVESAWEFGVSRIIEAITATRVG